MIARFFRCCASIAILATAAIAQRPDVNYDEAKVPAYALPDPLTMRNGEPVRDAATWLQKRRPPAQGDV